jgi:putative endonuclease
VGPQGKPVIAGFLFAMPYVYILYSQKLSKYYTGATSDSPQERLDRHLQHYYQRKFTAKADDWILFMSIGCTSMQQALAIEQHIKKMKASHYIENLRQYPELVEKLLSRYTDS